ncbi:MAG: AI-2E family transporter [Rhizobiales bacterium]|nr:AI-2E family transporter [Hyphomicrobiales bacterium]
MSPIPKRALPKRETPAPSARDHEHVSRISTQTTIFALIAVALILYEIQWILPPFVIAGLLAYITTPAIDWASARSGLPRVLLVLFAFSLFLLFATLIGYLGIPPLAREITHVFNDFEVIVRELAQRMIGSGKISLLGQPMDAGQLATAVGNGLRNWVAQTGVLATLGAAVFGTMFGLILTPVLLFYFLLSGPSMARGLLQLVPPGQRPLIMHIWTVLDPVLKRYFIGVLIVVAYASAAAYVGLGLVLGIPHAVLLALLTGVLEMIPVIGPGAAAVIAGLVAVHSAAGIGAIIAYALYATALRISIDQLFGPLALGTAARLHPVLVIFCFLSGGLLFGIVGVIMAVPVALVVKVTLALLYDEPTKEVLADQ